MWGAVCFCVVSGGFRKFSHSSGVVIALAFVTIYFGWDGGVSLIFNKFYMKLLDWNVINAVFSSFVYSVTIIKRTGFKIWVTVKGK